MIDENGINNIINNLINLSEEFELLSEADFQIKIVDDIYSEVSSIDADYAKLHLQNQLLYGLLFATIENKHIVFIRSQDIVQERMNITHELAHLCDYIRFATYRTGCSFRQLQLDVCFLIWTEFHATYLSYMDLLSIGKSCLNPTEVAEEIRQKLVDYLTRPLLQLNETLDKSVRSYGTYMALQSNFPTELNKHPKQYYYDQNFLNIYDFLWEHRTFESFIEDYDIFETLLKETERK